MSFTMEIAGTGFRVESEYEVLQRICRDYLCETEAAETLTVDEADVLAEKAQYRDSDTQLGLERSFSDSVYISNALFRKVAEALPYHDGFPVHGSCIAVDGKAYLFLADSGTGKSTHTRLWREHFGEAAFMVNDDKPVLVLRDGVFYACGTPWRGKHRLGQACKVPLAGICLLQRGEKNRIGRLPQEEALASVYRYCYHPFAKEALLRVVALLPGLTAQVPIYNGFFNMEQDAPDVSFRGMGGTR